jgi:hypothetical protein
MLSSIGALAVSTSRAVMVMLRSHGREVKRHLGSVRTQTLVLGEGESVCSILTTTSNYSGIVEGHSSEAAVSSLIANPKDARKPDGSKPGMMGDGTEEQNLDQPGNPAARIKKDEVADAFRNPPPKK